MCGISGAVKNVGQLYEQELLSMFPGIAHRGPDGKGVFAGNCVGLLHTRLSIIDTSDNANQPLYNEDRTLVLVCNGEIYNYLTLRAELELKGHRFHSHSDSEVLLHLYEEYKDEPSLMLNKLKGMFAFAIYDIPNSTLFLARDRFGIKPLYYANDHEGFYFSSEMKSIIGIRPDLKDHIDYSSMFEYFQFLSIPEPNTIYEKVKSFPSGHFGIIKKEVVTFRPWYLLEQVADPGKYTDSKAFSSRLFEKVESVAIEHLVSDVPIGSFLSAGIDSTVVSHFCSLNCKGDFTSISAGFPNYPEDESSIAKETAEKLGLRHYTFTLGGDFFDDAEEIMSYFDQPFAISSAFSLFRISKLARRKMKVVLTGDGGDEVFAGYDHKHKPFYVPSLVNNTPEFLRPYFAKFLSVLPGKKLKAISEEFCRSSGERFLNRSRVLSGQEAMTLIPVDKRKFVDRNRFLRHVNDLFNRSKRFSELHQLLYADLNTFLKSEMLYKVDRMTMANALEGRVPFLDQELVEMAFRAEPSLLRNSKMGKIPLRNWVNEHYPGLGSRPKTGFNTPLKRLLKENESSRRRVADLFSELKGSGVIHEEELSKICNDTEQNVIHTNKIMLVICLAGWWKHTRK